MQKILKARDIHIENITQLALLLWPGDNYETLEREMLRYQEDSTAELFICEEENEIVGFAHVQLRYDYVEGTETKPVGYLEGIYVKEAFRQKGIARKLVEVGQDWSRFMGASEFASDVEIKNEISARFHEKIGFKEANRIICYTKKL
ncbi:aminoglycoside 6'-N-acetyltransferase [Alkalibacterium olivapovliticus]|uniref:Aminoglycoside N(6')-acetyltransferase type 1 n=1 Tax=Alkalibacterium olivapovliticus TaxID=99907 RepID=A0A2T0W5W8_9LACT|nr:aminoglycoside 6'-N-acetyltransferase [Alkalibacterium olivapovliticus]PRY81458.1 aminoglycoside 6'-N-acetyltransferase I [Alkalibacterium olivapovliticus]